MSTDQKLSTVALTDRGRKADGAEAGSTILFAAAGAVVISSIMHLKTVLYPAQNTPSADGETATSPAEEAMAAPAELAPEPVATAPEEAAPESASGEAAADAADLIAATQAASSGRANALPRPSDIATGAHSEVMAGRVVTRPVNDNQVADPGLVIGRIGDGGGTGGGSGNGTGAGDSAPRRGTAADDGQLDERRNTAAPVVKGPVRLTDQFVNHAIVIALADLLSTATDANGDELFVTGLSADSGELYDNGDGSWLFVPAIDDEGEVRFSYLVSDGFAGVEATALIDLVAEDPLVIGGTDGADGLSGGAAGEIILAGFGDDTIYGNGGADLIDGESGNDIIFGGAGDDLIRGGAGNDVIDAGAGDDSVYGGDGADVIHGGDGNDILLGEAGDDIVYGDAGDDVIVGGSGNDIVNGGSGSDRFLITVGQAFAAPATLAIDASGAGNSGGDNGALTMAASLVAVTTPALPTIETVAATELAALELAGPTAVGIAFGSQDIEQVAPVAPVAATPITPDTTPDTTAAVAGAVAGTYDASASRASVTIDLGAATATGKSIGSETLGGIENVIGTSRADTIVGNDAANVLNAGAGDDVADGGGGDDSFAVGAMAEPTSPRDDDRRDRDDDDDDDDDRRDDGDDSYDGGDGIDTFDASAAVHDLSIDLSAGIARGEDIGRDTLRNIENAVGGAGDDRLVASSTVNVLEGGAGEDTFVFADVDDTPATPERWDTIRDFSVGDKIDISRIDGDEDREGHQRFEYRGEDDHFTGPGQLRIRFETDEDGEHTFVLGNVNDDLDADFMIKVIGRYTFNANDFEGVH